MTKAWVKCLYCGEQFDRNSPKEEFVKIGRRYAHKHCAEEHDKSLSQEEKDLRDLITYIKELLGDDYNFMKVKKQIEEYHKNYNFTYSGMLRSLKWFYEVRGQSTDKANGGIGIIPFIYKDAYNYYYNIFLAQQKNKGIEDFKVITQEVTIPSPRMYVRPPRLLEFEKDEDEEE